MSKRTKILIFFTVGFTLAGLMVVVLIYAFILGATGEVFSFDLFLHPTKTLSVLYLTRLIPIVSGGAGYLAGKFLVKRRSDYETIIGKYHQSIERVIEFASNIERGSLQTPYQPVNGEVALTVSLEKMRMGLVKLKNDEDERNEIAEIKTKVNNILRSIDKTDRLAEEVISFLVRRIDNVVQGAFYLASRDDDGRDKLTLSSTFAYDRKKYLKAEFKFAEGLVGQAAVEKDMIHRTEIPEDYVTITSGLLGHKKPKSILITPLISNDVVYGVLELAAIRKFSDSNCKLIFELSEIIARSIFNVRVNEETRHLLRESEEMSKELVSQKQKLVENASEMIETQEELKRTNSKLGEQIHEVHKSTTKTRILLENSSEVIFISGEDGTIKYVSPSSRSILGYYPDEITGKQSIENMHPQDTERFQRFLQDITSFPEKKHSLQFRYFTKRSEILWLEAAGKNFIEDPVIQGIVINARDISGQRLAASEQRMRAKMQALSENSTDLILRVDIFSRCTYVNPVIECYTGLDKENILDKPLAEIEMDESIISSWKDILNEVAGKKEKCDREMNFPGIDGEKIMHVSAIPEFYDNGEVESVLFVCHDISQARNREELIKKKNKSINDSINYAYYIQSSLMPSEERLRQMLPNSFMFYRPKDIVSGDYPFVFKDGHNIYIGAMDCTGHGVPGALMSIIGYFLQNKIINSHSDDDAGQVLNRLHEDVVRTLRQYDENSRLNDGMDAALCKIDTRNNVLNFAGAHRPLYHVRRGDFHEIRGDRFPVGGTQYNNRKDFTNHIIEMEPGDSFYFMTDGYADQYGGPTGKQKFMSGRVNKLIKENTDLSIFQMGNLFRKTFEEWKGSNEQLDDVLLIGLKF
ncbi:MAG TPA: PAS domain S-box protein [Bacteroidales bacterium]|nr:PAS domain S-box protein [Bacteroidales bacterium]